MTVTVVSSAEQQLAHLPGGMHVCAINSTPAEQMGLLVPFVREGLRRHERCVLLLDVSDIPDVLGRLEADGLDVSAAMDTRALQVLSARDAYLRDGRFDPDAMMEFWLESYETAVREGWTGLRGTGDMSWTLGGDVRSEALIQYEARLNELPPATAVRLLCYYDRSRFPAIILGDVLRAHPHAVLGQRVHDNPYYEPPALMLQGAGRAELRVDWMLDQIQRRTHRTAVAAELGAWALERMSPTELMNAAAHTLFHELRASIVEVFSFPARRGLVTRRAVAGIDETRAAEVHFDLSEVWPERNGVSGRDPLLVTDWSQSLGLPLRAELAAHDIRSSAAFPIGAPHTGPVHGVVWLHSAEPRIFTDDEVMYVSTVVNMLGEAFARGLAEGEFDLVVEHATDVIARFDHDLRYTYVNPAIETITGVPAATLIGKTIREAGLHESDASAKELVLHLAWRTGREQSFEFVAPKTPLGERHFQTRIMPELGPDNAVQSLLAVSRDVTEQRQAEAERARLYPALLEQQARLTDLMAHLEIDRARVRQLSADEFQAAQLTARQRDVLRLLVKGWTNRQIAAELHVSTGTVKNQVARIMALLGASRRAEAAVRAVTMGIAAAE